MKADLHLHSTRSDGSDSVKKIIDEGALRGLSHMSFTEHDGYCVTGEDVDYALSKDIVLIPGIEISAYDHYRKQKVHILGYAFDYYKGHIEKLCSPIVAMRQEMGLKQMATLQSLGVPLESELVKQLSANSNSIYKQHILKALVETGFIKDLYGDFYRTHFKSDGPCDREIAYVDAAAAIEAIHLDGGIAVLAHPALLHDFDVIPGLVSFGLDGIEMHHISKASVDLGEIEEIIERYSLIVTGGSDCHGEYGDEPEVGAFTCDEKNLHIILDHCSPWEIRQFAETMVRELGRLLRDQFVQNPEVTFKKDDPRDLLTAFDLWVDDELREAIRRRFPNHVYFSEESSIQSDFYGPYVWVADPIDGTTNFVNLNKEFSISLCFFSHGRPVVGVVYDVSSDRLYSAEAGIGAWSNRSKLSALRAPLTLKETLIDMSLNTLSIAKDHYNTDLLKLAGELRGHRAYGAASLSIVRIALGELHFYLSSKLNLWDYAAATLILKEVGGVSLEPRRYAAFSADSKAFLASASHDLQCQLVEKIDFLE